MSREVATARSLSLDFERLRVSALTRAAAVSPQVRDVTIGPNSPRNKRDTYEDTQSLVPPTNQSTIEVQVKDHVSREDRIFIETARRYEEQKTDSSIAHFEEMMNRMKDRYNECAERCRRQQEQLAQRNELALRTHILQMLKAWDFNDRDIVRERVLCKRGNQDDHTTRNLENVNKIIEERNEVEGRLSAIADSHAVIYSLYDEISEILGSDDKHVRAVYDKYVMALNTVVTNMNKILDLCASEAVTDKEVKLAQVLALNIVNLKKKALDEIAALKEEETEKQKEQELKFKRDVEICKEIIKTENDKCYAIENEEITNKADESTEKNLVPQSTSTPRAKPLFYSKKNYEYYVQLKNFLNTFEISYSNLTSDTRFKDFCFDCRKAVNVPVNALCSVSGIHIRDKYEKLSKLLGGERVQVMNSYVCASQHPQGLAYCMALLAKKLVNQGHLIVSSKPEAAFPLASVIIALWSQFPDLGRLIEANFQKECPYLVPMFLPQTEGQTDQDFYKARGYLFDDEGIVEKQDMFLKRMSGCFRLMCAIWIAAPPKVMNGPNPYGLNHAWKWIASFVNLKPESQISATLLHDFFSVCGNECMKTYGKQFTKVIKLICLDYLPTLDKIDEGGPKTRLEVFLQKVLQTGIIPPPSGQLPRNVW